MYAYEKKDPYTFSFTSADELRLYIENNGLDIPFSDDLSPVSYTHLTLPTTSRV